MADTTLQLIKTLPPELREKILKEFIKIKIKERKDLGWQKINSKIFYAPFCKTNEQIVKCLYCPKCDECDRNDLCNLCKKNGIDHYLNYPSYSTTYFLSKSSFHKSKSFLDWYNKKLVEKNINRSKLEENAFNKFCDFVITYFEETNYRSWYNSWREGEESFWKDITVTTAEKFKLPHLYSIPI